MKQKLKAGAGIGIIHFPETYFPSDGFSGVHDDMHAKVLLLEKGDIRGALVTLELPSIRPWALTDQLRAFAARLLDVPYENLWLIMTHDLAAPHVPKNEDGCRLHMNILQTAVQNAAETALASLQNVRAVYCEGTCDVNANRDMESIDGWWVGIQGSGPSDKTLSLLRFDAEDGKPLAVLYSYALKSSVLEAADMSDGKRYASGDVTGRAGTKAEDMLGCPVLFVMGAAGEQVPKQKANYLALDENRRFYTVNLAEEGYEILEELSDVLANSICTTAQSGSVSQLDSAVLRFGHFSFHGDGQIPYANTLPQPPVLHFDYLPAAGEEIPMWYLQIGNAVMLGVKPEIMTPTFDKIKANSPFPCTMMATLVNGGQGYIARDWDYEHFTYPGLKTPFRKGTDRIFEEKVSLCLRSLSEKEI